MGIAKRATDGEEYNQGKHNSFIIALDGKCGVCVLQQKQEKLISEMVIYLAFLIKLTFLSPPTSFYTNLYTHNDDDSSAFFDLFLQDFFFPIVPQIHSIYLNVKNRALSLLVK